MEIIFGAKIEATMAKQHRYDIDLNHPEIIKLCESCTRVDCPGICLDYKNLSRKLAGYGRLRYRDKQVRKPSPMHVYNKQFEAFGESHTLREWAKITGMAYHTLYNRMTVRNMTMQEAIQKPIRHDWNEDAISHDGKSMTLMEWSKELGVNYTTLRNRLLRGWTPEQTLMTPVLPHGISREEWEDGNRNDTEHNHKESNNADR